jgi:hypothetical protein
LRNSLGNIVDNLISSFQNMKSRKYLSKLLLISGFWLLVAIKAFGQPCPSNLFLTFYMGRNTYDDLHKTIQACGAIDPGDSDIDIFSPNNLPGATSYQWEYRVNSGTWVTDPSATGNQYPINSFRSVIGFYEFRLTISIPLCPPVTSPSIDLTVTSGTTPNPPSGIGASFCNTGQVTLIATVAISIWRRYDSISYWIKFPHSEFNCYNIVLGFLHNFSRL